LELERSVRNGGRSGRDDKRRDGADGVRLRSFERSLPMALLRAREAVMRRFRASLRQHGITEQQWRVLRALSSAEQMEILALAEVTFLLPPSLSRILRDLDRRKLIVRRAAPDDLRRGLVSIAPRGVTLIERVGVESEGIYGEITAEFGAGNLRALHELLARLEQVLTAPAIPRRKATPARSRAGR
jgi:homoprotocatechuate degradation regulator HpaR